MNRRGMVYTFSLGVVVLLTIASASLLMRGVTESNQSERQRNYTSAFHLADAGVDQAAFNLRTPTDLTDDVTDSNTLAVPLSTGRFTIDSPQQLGTFRWGVATHGTSAQEPNLPRHIEAVFQLTPESVFQFALFGANGLNVSGSAITDSYDSRLGAYDPNPNNHDHHGDVGTNVTTPGGVTVGGSIFIDGQVAVGPGVNDPVSSVVTGYDPAFITGGTSPPSNTQDVVAQSSTFPMPDVDPPVGLSCSDYTITGGTQLVLDPAGGPLGNGTYCYHDLTVQGNADLLASGPVTVYLTGDLIARGDSSVGVSSDPRLMTILMTPSAAATLEQGTITGSTKFYGALYGPKATITISGNADVYGSIVAKQVNVTGSASIHYDEAMTDLTNISNLYRTSLVAWRERTDL